MVVEDRTYLQQYIRVLSTLKTVKYYVLCKDVVPEDLPEQLKGKVFSWKQFMQLGTTQYSPSRK